MAFRVIFENYLNILMAQQLLQFLEFHYHRLEQAEQLCFVIIQPYT